MDGTRTRDHSDHNRELYQLSYHRRRGAPYATAVRRPSSIPLIKNRSPALLLRRPIMMQKNALVTGVTRG